MDYDPWVTTIGIILGIIGPVLAIVFYYKSLRIKIPTYSVRSLNVVTDSITKVPNLEMQYLGVKVQNLTISNLAFWNDGRETMRNTDIAKTDPLRIEIKSGFEMLDAQIISVINKANQFKINTLQEKTVFKLDFEYVDRNEGVIIQIVHNGKTNDDVQMCGMIKGAGAPKRKEYTPRIEPKPGERLKVGIVFSFFLIFFTALLLPSLFSNNRFNISDATPLILMWILLGGIAIHLLRRNVPVGFELFERDFLKDTDQNEKS